MDRIVRPPSIFDRALWPDEPFDTTVGVVKIGTTTFETGFDAATATGAPCRVPDALRARRAEHLTAA